MMNKMYYNNKQLKLLQKIFINKNRLIKQITLPIKSYHKFIKKLCKKSYTKV